MGKIVAIEGADGVGKNTTSRTLQEVLQDEGHSAAIIGFPRYGETLAGVVIGKMLAGEFEHAASPHAAATLYALDRFEWREHVAEAVATHDVLIFDRYIASGMAYQAARVPEGEARAMMDWILSLETGQFALPRPDLSIYLDTPWEMAKAMILQKAQRSYTDRVYDEYEADAALQARVRSNYETMVAADLLGPWQIVRASEGGAMRPPETIAREIMQHIDRLG